MKSIKLYAGLLIIFLMLTFLIYKLHISQTFLIIFIVGSSLILFFIIKQDSIKGYLRQFNISDSFLASTFYWDILFVPYLFFLFARNNIYASLIYIGGLFVTLGVLTFFFYEYKRKPENRKELKLVSIFGILALIFFIIKLI